MKKQRIDIWVLADPVYKFGVNFILGGTYRQFLDEVEKHTKKRMKTESGTTLGCFYHDYKRDFYFLWLPTKHSTSTLVHELVHVIFTMFLIKGVPTANQNQETFAYHLQWWLEEVQKCIKKSK